MPDEPQEECVAYARYSSHNQKDTSIEDQVRDIETYCRLNNLKLVKVYADRHLTGTTDKRPQFQQMLKDAAHARWRYVVVWKTDRFARNRYDSATYKYRLKKHGIRVLSVKESIPDGPEGILLESVLEGSAEYYSANLSQNIKRGMMSNAMNCMVNNGALPFGYCKGPDGRYAVVEAEAEIVREIFRKVAEGIPFTDIANDLNGRGIRTKVGNLWNKGSFHRMLTSPAYIGTYRYSDVVIEGGMPAIVDKELFLRVQQRLQSKPNPQGRHRDNGEYLLTGKLFCGLCGARMVGVAGTGKSGAVHNYYQCQERRLHHACPKENVRREWLEQEVTRLALEHVLQPDVIEWIADQVMAYQNREAASSQLGALRAELDSVEEATRNVMKAIEAGIITTTTKRRLQELEADAARISDAIYLEEASLTKIEREFVVFWLEKFRGGDLESQEFRRKVIDTFVAAVYLWDDRIRIAFNYSGKKADVSFALVADAESHAGEECSYKLPVTPPKQDNPNHIFLIGDGFGFCFIIDDFQSSRKNGKRKS